jgi:hypothetical protein
LELVEGIEQSFSKGRFDAFTKPSGNGRSLRIVLKNSNFRIDHNSGTAGGVDEKFLRGSADRPVLPRATLSYMPCREDFGLM